MVETISLNGYWDWELPGGMWQRKMVPSSYICVGTSTYQKEVELHLPADKQVFLCFDGIAYQGRLWFNDRALGDMLPYVPYRFDVSGCVKNGLNHIQVEIEDITADYGPTGGWEDYGGITRDAYIEVCDPIWIGELQWLCTFDEDCTAAQCRLNVSLDSRETHAELRVTVSLALNRQTVYRGEQTVHTTTPSAQVVFPFNVENPLLWTPDHPILYDVEVTLEAGGIRDEKRIRVGFREFKAVGSRLYLNGKDIFLKGVARHEMWGDHQGFTLTLAQIEQDLRLIKNMGANFVRLVHYPHSRPTIELCDRLGLMVTEEPGLWWSDLTDEATTSKALQIMEKTILRDRNNPSVIAWLLYNECRFAGALEYLTRGKALCNRLDPGRLVSAANCLDPLEARQLFDQAGMDFYTFHPYAYEPNLMVQGMEALRGKPCVFTEWGGYLFMDNPNLKLWFKRVITEYSHNRDPKPNLAGMAWWQFQDVFQFSRGLPACVDGTLTDGLVDRYRNKKPMYDVMADYFAAVDSPSLLGYRLETSGQLVTGEDTRATIALDLTRHQDSAAQHAAWDGVLYSLKVFQAGDQSMIRRHMGPVVIQQIENIGGLCVRLSGRPLILARGCRQVTIECGFAAQSLYFLGQTSFFDGYPLRGRLGEVIAHYTINYHDGSRTAIDLRNGYEMASATMIARTSRIDPIAVNTNRVIVLHMEEDWEIYQVRCLKVETTSREVIDSIEFDSASDDFYPLLYGISASICNTDLE